MVRVTLEDARMGIQDGDVIEIDDDGTGNAHVGNYIWDLKNASGRVVMHGRLTDCVRGMEAWTLVWAVLCQVQKAIT